MVIFVSSNLTQVVVVKNENNNNNNIGKEK
jgi:hypothetical protein